MDENGLGVLAVFLGDFFRRFTNMVMTFTHHLESAFVYEESFFFFFQGILKQIEVSRCFWTKIPTSQSTLWPDTPASTRVPPETGMGPLTVFTENSQFRTT